MTVTMTRPVMTGDESFHPNQLLRWLLDNDVSVIPHIVKDPTCSLMLGVHSEWWELTYSVLYFPNLVIIGSLFHIVHRADLMQSFPRNHYFSFVPYNVVYFLSHWFSSNLMVPFVTHAAGSCNILRRNAVCCVASVYVVRIPTRPDATSECATRYHCDDVMVLVDVSNRFETGFKFLHWNIF